MADDFKIGFAYYLLEIDNRYTTVIEKAITEEWSFEDSMTHFGRKAVKLGDTDSGPAKDTSALHIASNHEANAGEHNKGKGKGKGGGGSGKGKGGEQTADALEVVRLKKEVKALLAKQNPPSKDHPTPDKSKKEKKEKEICRKFQEGTCTRGDRCRFSHANANSGQKETPKKDKAPGVCFAHKANPGTCSRGDSCKFSHEANMLSHSPPVTIEVGCTVAISPKLTKRYPYNLKSGFSIIRG